VAYAGSLLKVNEQVIGPAFTRATGYHYQGRGAGSFGLAKEIEAGEINPGVFMSVGAAPIEQLGSSRETWYVQTLSSPLVVAYNPSSKFGAQLAAIADSRQPLSDLFSVMSEPGFRLGRTNPNTDPQGQAFVEMVELATSQFGLPASTVNSVLGSVDNPAQIFAETALDSQLEAGSLDAASAFESQAIQLKLPYITLPASIDFGDPALARTYAQASVTLSSGQVVRGVPLVIDTTVLSNPKAPLSAADRRAAAAFVAYLLSPAGQAAYSDAGYQVLKPPEFFGSAASLPGSVRQALQADKATGL
jgi:molybdate/tungstate transport system substrate-binding protein